MPFIPKIELNNESPKEVVNRLLQAINTKFANKWLDNPGERLRLTPKVEETKKDRLCTTIFGDDRTLQSVMGVIIQNFRIHRLESVGLNFIEGGDKRELDIQQHYPGITRIQDHRNKLEQISEKWTEIVERQVSASSSSSAPFVSPENLAPGRSSIVAFGSPTGVNQPAYMKTIKELVEEVHRVTPDPGTVMMGELTRGSKNHLRNIWRKFERAHLVEFMNEFVQTTQSNRSMQVSVLLQQTFYDNFLKMLRDLCPAAQPVHDTAAVDREIVDSKQNILSLYVSSIA
mmetsp:Transcript_6210/g.10333  ORF Transcript_6210/g.10333 Transcript_6210/m.10333 type:complete len:287 (+) Transcript_6210:29-889(+)